MTKSKKQYSDTEILDKVIIVGPDYRGNGGMSSVMAEYRQGLAPFHYLPTNSIHGTTAGLANVALAMAKLPLLRLKGRRLLHIHYAGLKSWPRKKLVLRWGRMLGYKTIMHCHCDLWRLVKDKGKPDVTRTLGSADANIVLGSAIVRYAKEELGLDDFMVIRNPISYEGKGARPGTTPVTFLFLGELCTRKRPEHIIEAAARLQEQGRDFRLIFAGDGYIDKCRQLAEDLGIADKCTFTGWIRDERKKEVIAKTHVFVLPSFGEGMPMTILEAKCAGIPSVSTNIAGIPDIIEDGKDGFLIEPGDIEALADRMAHYIDSPELLATHSAASADTAHLFKMPAIRQTLLNLYCSILPNS